MGSLSSWPCCVCCGARVVAVVDVLLLLVSYDCFLKLIYDCCTCILRLFVMLCLQYFDIVFFFLFLFGCFLVYLYLWVFDCLSSEVLWLLVCVVHLFYDWEHWYYACCLLE